MRLLLLQILCREDLFYIYGVIVERVKSNWMLFIVIVERDLE